jgi:hypothetical protein
MKFTFIQKSIVATVGAVALLGSTAGAGHAWSFNEAPGDAGRTLATAEDLTTTPGPLTGTDEILGKLAENAKADLFKFTVAAESIFTAEVFGRSGRGGDPLKDSQLFLFDGAGNGIVGNDDQARGNLLSKITTTLMAGDYYLGISAWDYDPINAAGKFIFRNNQVGDQGLRPVSSLLANWAIRDEKSDPTGGLYKIALTTERTPVPTPALLPGLAALGFGAIRKRKAKAAVA